MNHTAKLDLAPSEALDNDVMEEMENNEATGIFDYKPDTVSLTDANIADDEFLDNYEDLDATDILDESLLFNIGET